MIFQPKVSSTHLLWYNVQELCLFWADFDLSQETYISKPWHFLFPRFGLYEMLSLELLTESLKCLILCPVTTD